MNIRPATAEDLPALVFIGRMMRDESPRFREMDFDDDTLSATLRQVLDAPTGLLLVAERDGEIVGGVAAVLIPSWFGRDLTSCDLALFIRQDRRGGIAAVKLLERYASWAKARKAKPVLLGIMTGVNVEQTEKLCARLGWRRAGVVMEC
jgi:Acetyltransferase (GNAT) family